MEKFMKIIVCDDNKNYANSLMDNIANIISKSTLFENIPFDCKYIYPAKLLFEYAKKHPIDILFLDISMPGTDGLDIAETFHDYYPSTKLLFITNYEQYVFYSFRFSPFRYIRKNNLNNELEEALLSATNDIYNNNDFITITNRDQCIQISLSNIMYFEKEKTPIIFKYTQITVFIDIEIIFLN